MYKVDSVEKLEMSNKELYENGKIRSGFPRKEYIFMTNYGSFVAQFQNNEERKKTTNSLEFFEDGNIKKISLQNRTKINTSVGEIKAELILFYNSGKLRKIFPLNGRLTGFWGENQEKELAENFSIEKSGVKINNKIINFEFYESGKIKGITFWPGETAFINIEDREIKIKNGITFYESGGIRSFETVGITLLNTVIGKLNIQNTVVNGGLGSSFSTILNQDGSVRRIKTTTDRFEVFHREQLIDKIEPKMIPSWCSDSIMIPEPLEVEFESSVVRFGGKIEYDMKVYHIKSYNDVVNIRRMSACQ